MTSGEKNELGSARDRKLLVNVMEMDLNRPLRDGEALRNLLVSQSLRRQSDDFDLTGREQVREAV